MLKVVGASWFQTMVSLFIIVSILVFGIFAIFFCDWSNTKEDGKYAATVSWHGESKLYNIDFWGQNNNPATIKRGAARAYYQPDMQHNGWAILEIESNPKYPDEVQAFASGMLEGSLSWQHIYWQWTNTVEQACEDKEEFCERIRKFLEQNTDIIRSEAKSKDLIDPFWHHVNLFYIQLDGMEFGWRYQVKRNREDFDIPHLDFLWMNIVSDLKDFEKILLYANSTKYSPVAMSLLKLLATNDTKFLLAHASSGFYSSMLRIQKKYKFGYHVTGIRNAELAPGRTVAFTSYPGSIHSQDDFYQLTLLDGSKATVTGTAIYNLDAREFELVKVLNKVLLGPRVMASNRLSRDGKSWTKYLKRSNSGTGNKQWMHIHTKNSNLSFWISEQTFFNVDSRDETDRLIRYRYWISCGIPFYKEPENSWKMTSSPNGNHSVNSVRIALQIGQQYVSDMKSLVSLMRGPDLSLVGRTDLHDTGSPGPPTVVQVRHSDDKPTNHQVNRTVRLLNFNKNDSRLVVQEMSPWRRFNLQEIVTIIKEKDTVAMKRKKNHTTTNSVMGASTIDGVIDLKITCDNKNFLAAAGPPYNTDNKTRTIEPFQWSKSKLNYLPHNGHSDIWNYKPVEAGFVWD